jgi:hypothetical protein
MTSSEVAGRLEAPRVSARGEWTPALLWLALAATAVVAPMFFWGDASGHDFQYHVASWVEVAHQWREGILFPRWAEWANWGYGEPRFIFYPPASRLIGAALGLVLPWTRVATAYIWLALVGGGMAMWALARERLSRNEAVAASVFFALNPYNLALVYYRSDFAELLTVAMFPLLILAVLRIAQDSWRRVPFFALISAGIWMCDAPGAVIATYSAALLLIAAWLFERKWRTLSSGATGTILGLGPAAFYILPAAWEQKWANLGFAVEGNYRIQHNFLFSHAGDPEFIFFNLRISAIALGMILVCGVLGVFVARRRHELRHLWWMLVALGGASIFVMFPASNFLWHLLPKLRFVQFPWRWMDALTVVFAFCAAAALGGWRRRWLVWTSLLLLLAGTAAAMARSTWWDSDDASDIVDAVNSGLGYEGTDEFAPRGTQRYELYGVNPDGEDPPEKPIPIAMEFNPSSGAMVPATGVRFHVKRWTAERRILSEESAHPVNLALRLLAYPAWEARVDGQAVPIAETPTGPMWLQIPAGRHQIDLCFRRTWDRTAGGAISILSGILLLVWAGAQRFATRAG